MSDKDGRYPLQSPGEVVKLRSSTQSLRFACCDCGLVHEIVVKAKRGGWVWLAAYRSRATGGHRRGRKNLVENLLAIADRFAKSGEQSYSEAKKVH